MSFTQQLPKYLVLAVVAAGLALFANRFIGTSKDVASVDVRVPKLSAIAVQGKQAFDANCAQCHGKNGSGTNQGPPLIHNIYNPGHHADQSFFLAVKRGVRRHHWPYGNMPPQPHVTQDQVAAIVKYIREIQVANGITYKPHRM